MVIDGFATEALLRAIPSPIRFLNSSQPDQGASLNEPGRPDASVLAISEFCGRTLASPTRWRAIRLDIRTAWKRAVDRPRIKPPRRRGPTTYARASDPRRTEQSAAGPAYWRGSVDACTGSVNGLRPFLRGAPDKGQNLASPILRKAKPLASCGLERDDYCMVGHGRGIIGAYERDLRYEHP